MEWLRTQKAVYLGNASALKDYRVQLRGNRAVWFWLGYLLLLTFFALVNYSAADLGGSQSISSIQTSLYGFYLTVLQTVQTVVLLVAPILASQGIVNEFERRSYDLVMSSPVSPKYFLVGKLISGARTMLLLLILSLPVASLGVIMGGATWGDVFNGYAYLWLQGIMVMAVSMPIALMTRKMPATVFYTYGIVFLTGPLVGITMAMSAMTAMMGATTSGEVEMLFYTGLLPYMPALYPTTVTQIMGVAVPNLLLAAVFAGLIVKFALVGGGSVMGRERSAETKSFRLHGLAICALVGTLVAVLLPPDVVAMFGGTHPWAGRMSAMGGGGSFVEPEVLMYLLGGFVAALLMVLVPFFSHLSTYSYTDGKKFEASSLFRPPKFLTADPGGGLTYLLVLALLLVGPLLGLLAWSGVGVDLWLAASAWTVAFVAFCWSAGWFVSSRSKNISAARRGTFGLVLAAVVVPVVLLGLVQSMRMLVVNEPTVLWIDYSPFHPFAGDTVVVILKVPILLALGALMAYSGEARRIQVAQQSGVIS